MADDFAAAAFDAGAFNVPQVAPAGVIVPYGTRTPTRPLLSFGRREGFMGGVNRANEVYVTSEPVQRDVRSGPTMTLRQATAEDEIMQAEDNTPEEDVGGGMGLDALSEAASEAASEDQRAMKRPKSAKSPKGKGGKSPKKTTKKPKEPKKNKKAKEKEKESEKPLPPKKRHKSPAGVIGLKPPAAKKARTHGAGGLPAMHMQTYIYKVLKQVHKDVGISTKGINVMNGIVAYAFGKIAENAASITRLRKGKTMTGSDVKGGVRLWMGENRELLLHAVSEATKAMNKYDPNVE